MSELETWPKYEDDEIAAVKTLLRSGKVNYWNGTEGQIFEDEFAAANECRHAIATANGTASLDIALHALGLGPGDDVVVTPRTYIASASSVVLRGARPVFADVDPVSQNITAETIKAALTPQTRGVICVHFAGWPCDMDPILDLCRPIGCRVIEDAAQAQGARYKGRLTGTLANIAAFSFCTDKIMSTGGEGGMLTTDDDELWRTAWSYKDHGKGWDAVFNREHPPGHRWVHESFGTNWRMSGIQAAIGRCQLPKVPLWLKRRRANASHFSEALRDIEAVRVTDPPANVEHAYYKYYFFVRPDRLKSGWTRDRVVQSIVDQGIPCFSGSCSEIYLEKAFERANLQPGGRLPVAKELGETSVMLLVHPTLTEKNMSIAAEVVRHVMIKASR